MHCLHRHLTVLKFYQKVVSERKSTSQNSDHLGSKWWCNEGISPKEIGVFIRECKECSKNSLESQTSILRRFGDMNSGIEKYDQGSHYFILLKHLKCVNKCICALACGHRCYRTRKLFLLNIIFVSAYINVLILKFDFLTPLNHTFCIF